eukprot:gene25060-32674_t
MISSALNGGDSNSVDKVDPCGMSALHWACVRNQEQLGMNTPLLLAASTGNETIARLLLERGASINARNLKQHDAVFMSVVYGHVSKGRASLAAAVVECPWIGSEQIGCRSHAHPDVETIRSFLDKGSSSTSYMDDSMSDTKSVVSSSESRKGPDIKAPTEPTSTYKWRPMEGTLEKVGDWAVRALPALLEICKKGGRFEIRDLDSLRPSFRAAVMEAREVWEKKSEPANFFEFVTAREHAGEDLRLGQDAWTKNNNSAICQLCSANFGLTNRRHHCRLCDGCFNRLTHEASQPSPDHFRVRQLKQCAVDAIRAIEQLIDSLDDPEGDPHNFNA